MKKGFPLKDPKLGKKFCECSEEDQMWVLRYLSSRKDIIPYEMITRFDSLDIFPE